MNGASSTVIRRTNKRWVSIIETILTTDNVDSNLDFVAFDFGVEGGDFGSEQSCGLALSTACLNQRTANQLRLEASHFSLQIDRVITLALTHVLGRRDLA